MTQDVLVCETDLHYCFGSRKVIWPAKMLLHKSNTLKESTKLTMK